MPHLALVITNRHVVQDNVSVTVRLSTGQTLPGRVETSSAEYDLAVVRVDGASPNQPLLPLGTVNDVRPGQEVIAIGLALGVFQNSVTRGIISAVRRAERTVILQTDAAINPGNSGGPLLNRQGQVVGINTMKMGAGAESLGFAVAVDHARGLLSGDRRQPDTPLSTSAPVSQPLAPAFSTRSSTDTVRADGTRRYDQIVGTVARHAAQLDDYWDRIKANCAVRAAPGYDREWFGLWDGRTTLTSPEVSCGSAVRDLERLAAEVRSTMSTAAGRGAPIVGASGSASRHPAPPPHGLDGVRPVIVIVHRRSSIVHHRHHRRRRRLRLDGLESPVRIGIDARKLHDFGIGTYIRNLLRELAKIDQQTEYVVITRPQDVSVAASLGDNFRAVPNRSAHYSIAEQISIPLAVRRERLDLFHATHYVLPALTPSRTVVTIHDCIHLMFPEYLRHRLGYAYARASLYTAAHKSDRIFTVSEQSKRDILKFFNVRA